MNIVHIDDNTLTEKKSICEFRNVHKEFKNSSNTGIPPEGYMTSEEFRQRAVLKINKFCKENGIL